MGEQSGGGPVERAVKALAEVGLVLAPLGGCLGAAEEVDVLAEAVALSTIGHCIQKQPCVLLILG